MLELISVNVKRQGETVLKNISFSAKKGEWWMLIGANGAGKSTLIAAASGLLPYSGSIRLLGKEIKSFAPLERARIMGVLEQNNHSSFDYTVEELVRLGRYAHKKSWLRLRDDKHDPFVENALTMTDMKKLRNKKITCISGGERQRAFLAEVFAQNPDVLLLDEPTSALDMPNQKYIMDLIKDWQNSENHLILSSFHDVALARAYGSHALVLKKGQSIVHGDISPAFDSVHLNTAYDMDVKNFILQSYSYFY